MLVEGCQIWTIYATTHIHQKCQNDLGRMKQVVTWQFGRHTPAVQSTRTPGFRYRLWMDGVLRPRCTRSGRKGCTTQGPRRVGPAVPRGGDGPIKKGGTKVLVWRNLRYMLLINPYQKKRQLEDQGLECTIIQAIQTQ